MVELKWQDPPSRSGAASGMAWQAVIEELKRNPGRWALVTDKWKTSVAPAAFRQQGCERTTRKNTDGKTYSVYARFPRPTAAASPAAPAKAAEKAKVKEAIRTGTALTPPPAAPRPPKAVEASTPAPEVRPVNDMGLSKFLADRRARGAIDHRE